MSEVIIHVRFILFGFAQRFTSFCFFCFSSCFLLTWLSRSEHIQCWSSVSEVIIHVRFILFRFAQRFTSFCFLVFFFLFFFVFRDARVALPLLLAVFFLISPMNDAFCAVTNSGFAKFHAMICSRLCKASCNELQSCNNNVNLVFNNAYLAVSPIIFPDKAESPVPR